MAISCCLYAAAGLLTLIFGKVIQFELGVQCAGVLGIIASILFYYTFLKFGWIFFSRFLGVATLGVLFSNNVVLGVIVFVLYVFIGWLAGLVISVIGFCRFMTLRKSRKGT